MRSMTMIASLAFLTGGMAVQQPAAMKPSIAITFDDVPIHGQLPPGETRLQIAQSILSTLQANQMPPVYGFINARRLTPADPAHASTNTHDITPASPDYAFLTAWRAAGEPLGNHTANHLSLDDSTVSAFEQNILADEPVLATLMQGQDWHWLRFPYLQEGDTIPKRREIQAWLKEHHYRTAEVTMDFEDYLWNAPYARCLTNHDEKSIQLLRSSFLSSAGQSLNFYRLRSYQVYGREIPYVLLLHVGAFEAVMLPDLLKLYRHAGLQFVSLPQAESDAAYAEDPDIGEPGGGTLIDLEAEKRHIPVTYHSKPPTELGDICPISASK
jgi:peptidoglycan/xylan/chitin deacetylase (PgdA/CDA1 family)